MATTDQFPPTATKDSTAKRLVASALDFFLIAIPTLMVATLSAERFSIVGSTNGRVRFELADQARINEINDGLNRAVRLGNTVHTLSGRGLLLTITVLVVLTVVVLFVIPAARKGQTIGRTATGLPVRPSRLDGLEIIEVAMVEPQNLEQPGLESTGIEPTGLESTAAPGLAEERISTEHDISTELLVLAEVDDQAPDQVTYPVTDQDRAEDDDRDETSTEDESLEQAPSVVDRNQLMVTFGEHDRDIDDNELEVELDADVDIREDEPSDARRSTLRELFGPELSGAAAAQATLGDDDEYAAFAELDGLNLTDRAGHNRTGTGSYGELTLPESSLSESPLTVVNGSGTRRAATTAAGSVATATAKITPAWDENWMAWVYRDAETGRWFRHDEQKGRWIRIS